MKFIITTTILLLTTIIGLAQEITVIDNFTKWKMPGVKVYSAKFPDTLKTNTEGIINADIFPTDAIIIFDFMMFKKAGYTKQQLAKQNNTVILKRSTSLKNQNTSVLTTKEYSGDIPIFTNIINLDDDINIQTDDITTSDKITIRTNKSGTSIFQGLQSQKVLLAIDGIRLNDEIHKNGKIEGLLNFDNTMTQSIRQIHGPGFTIYSTDATGGVINYFTQNPPTSPDLTLNSKLQLNAKYETATNSFINNIKTTITTAKFTSYTSINIGNFGEIKMGKNRKKIPQIDKKNKYGLHTHLVTQKNNKDTIIENNNPYKQKKTNYQQIYILQKFRYKISDNWNIMTNLHYIKTSEVGIYSGITEINKKLPRFAQCKFDPQNKIITNINIIHKKETKLYNLISLNNSFITYNETRITRKYQSEWTLNQQEQNNIYKLFADFVKLTNNNARIAYGITYTHNSITSKAFSENIKTKKTKNAITRYPNLGNKTQTSAGYINIKWLGNPNFITYIALRTEIRLAKSKLSNNNPQIPLKFSEINTLNFAPTASIHLKITPIQWLETNIITTSSKHLPIIDEYAKIMAKDFIINIPTNKLKPEQNHTIKPGITLYPNDNLKIYSSGFLTYSQNKIITENTTINKLDSITLGTYKYKIVTKTNIKKAYIIGISAGIHYLLAFDNNRKKTLKITSAINLAKGKNIENNKNLPNISPIFGNTTITLKINSLHTKFTTIFNGQKKLSELSPAGEDYIEKAASTGFLPWQIYNIKITYNIKSKIKFSLGINNIFDKFYRPYANAIAAPGRNFIFSTKFILN